MKEKEILEKILKTNRIILVVLILMFILLTMGVSKMYSNKNIDTYTNTDSESEYNTDYDVSMFEEIEASDIASKTKKSKQVVYVGRASCGWCAAFLPTLWEAQEEYDYTTLYIDIAKIIDFSNGNILDNDAYDTMLELTGDKYEGYMEQNFGATPMVLVIEKGKIISAQTGYNEFEAFKQVLENAGY